MGGRRASGIGRPALHRGERAAKQRRKTRGLQGGSGARPASHWLAKVPQFACVQGGGGRQGCRWLSLFAGGREGVKCERKRGEGFSPLQLRVGEEAAFTPATSTMDRAAGGLLCLESKATHIGKGRECLVESGRR